jgi:tRNA dimethylallyltransferase
MTLKNKKITKNIPRVLAIVGPTGSGKTRWAKVIAGKFNGKLISVDSRQIYRGLDIGTAKDQTFPQALVDIADPSETFSMSDFQKAANQYIDEYLNTNNLPILVGGTGLYLNSVLYGYVIPDLKKESLKLRAELEKLTIEEILTKLKELDPDSAQKIDPRNGRRLVRALEVSLLSSRPFSKQQVKKNPKFKALVIGIDIPRDTLYAKIDARVEQMIKDGLIEEVRTLVKKYPFDAPAFNTIGYKEIIDYLKSKISLPEAIQQIKFNTHSYVRRQMTWFGHDENIKWVKTVDEAEKLVQQFLKRKYIANIQ